MLFKSSDEERASTSGFPLKDIPQHQMQITGCVCPLVLVFWVNSLEFVRSSEPSLCCWKCVSSRNSNTFCFLQIRSSWHQSLVWANVKPREIISGRRMSPSVQYSAVRWGKGGIQKEFFFIASRKSNWGLEQKLVLHHWGTDPNCWGFSHLKTETVKHATAVLQSFPTLW